MLTQIIPSYLYTQYQDEPLPDPYPDGSYAVPKIGISTVAVTGRGPEYTRVSDLQAFVDSYNSLAQGYLNSVNDLNLPIYTLQSGALLDWVAFGIYGMQRPSLSSGTTFTPYGVYNTVPYNETAYSEDVKGGGVVAYVVTDDYFKRILTWNFYKGDTFQFTIPWLKRRIKRFLYGENGVDFEIGETYEISIANPDSSTLEITIPDLPVSPIFEAALQQGVLNVPFQFNYTVTY